MYVPKEVVEAMAEIFDDPSWEGDMDATTIAMSDLEDRIASETGLSEQAQTGEAMLSGKVAPLAIHR